MVTLTIETEDRRVLRAIRSFLEIYGVPYSENETEQLTLEEKIHAAREEKSVGELKAVNPKDIWQSIS